PVLLLALFVGCGRQNAEVALPKEKEEVARAEPQRPEVEKPWVKTAGEVQNLPEGGSLVASAEPLFDPVGQSPQHRELLSQLQNARPRSSIYIKPASEKLKRAAEALSGAKPQNGYNGQNAEAYGVYAENDFRSPLVAPLSTFSADVNTASYSNVRRMLND